MVGLFHAEWCTIKNRGKEILYRARDPERCLRQFREKMAEFMEGDQKKKVIPEEKLLLSNLTAGKDFISRSGEL